MIYGLSAQHAGEAAACLLLAQAREAARTDGMFALRHDHVGVTQLVRPLLSADGASAVLLYTWRAEAAT
eukprot:1520874-Prymnesium_polylepis.1